MTETLSTPKPTQRSRLIRAMLELSGSRGYHGVSIARLCAGAGVSTQTFYEHFADKEDVLVGAYRACAEQMCTRMRSAVSDGEISQLSRAALGALLEAVANDPDTGRLLFVGALSGGERMSEARRRTFHRLECCATKFLEFTTERSATLDIPVIAVVGALRQIVSRHLRNYAEDELPARLDDALAWLYGYARSPCVERWSTSRRALLEDFSLTFTSPPQEGRRERLPSGRHGLPTGVIARHQRSRLIFATAELMIAKGYVHSTVADIVAQARVAKPVFYRFFTDKQHAFLEAQQYPTQFIVDRCTEAYFSSRQWPARVWRTLEVLIRLVVANPAMSYLVIVECYRAGPTATRRAEELTRSFSFFLEEGYGYRAAAGSLPRLCSEAIAGAIFEIVRRHVAEGDLGRLARRLPQLAYIAIAPFVGAEGAIGLVEKITAQDRGRG